LLPLNLKSSLEVLSDICVQQISNLTILDKENIPPQMTTKEEDIMFACFGPDSDQEDDRGPTKKKPQTQNNNDDDFDDEHEEIKPVPKRKKLAKDSVTVGTKKIDAEGEQQIISVANDDDDDTLFSQTPSTVDPYDGYSETSNQTPSTISRRSYHNSDSDDDLFADADSDDDNAATTTTHKHPKQSSVKQKQTSVKSSISRKQPSTSEQKSSAQLKPASASQSQVPTIKAAAQKISASILKHVPVPNYPLATHPAQKSQHDGGEEEEEELEDEEENEDESVYSHSQAGGGRQKGKTVNI
jgi:hypothetical protein